VINDVYLLRKAMSKKVLASLNGLNYTTVNPPVCEEKEEDFYLEDELNETIAKLPARLRNSVGKFFVLAEYTRANTYLSLSLEYQPYFKRVEQIKKNDFSFASFNDVGELKVDKEYNML